MRRGMAQRQHFERRAHLGHFPDLAEIESSNAHATARLADRQPLRLEAAEGLPHRDVAGAEFLGDMVLAQPRSGLDRARNDAVRQFLADADGDRVVCAGHIFIDNLRDGRLSR